MKKDKSTLIAVIVLAITAVVGWCVDEPTYMHDGETVVLQGWIGSLISGIVSLGGGIASAFAANDQAKKADAERAKAEQTLKNWYDTNMNTSILDRADTLSMLKIYRDTMDEQARKYQTNAIKGGASEEAKVAYAQSQNKAYADAISKIAAQGQARKDQVADAYMKELMGIHADRANNYLLSGQQMANAISGAANGLGSALGGIEWGKKK